MDWATAISEYERSAVSNGRAKASANRQARRLAQFGRMVGGSPWGHSTAEFATAIEGLAVSAESRRMLGMAVRSFYRWAVDAGHIITSPAPPPSPRGTTLDPRWVDALERFEVAQGAAGISTSTLATRRKHVQRFAREVALLPHQVNSGHVQAWLDVVGRGVATVAAHRQALRAFYRWAVAERIASTDPTDSTMRRGPLARALPSLWEEPIRAFAASLRGLGRQESTVHSRRESLAQFAHAHALIDPWLISLDDVLEWMGRQKWQPETRRRMRGALIAFYRWAVESGRIEASPLERFPIVKAGRPRPRPALEQDYRRALTLAEPDERLALRLAAELGLRRAEVARLHSRDLSGRSGEFELLVHGKDDRMRTLPVLDDLAGAIRARGDGYLFPGQDAGHVSPRWLGKRITRLLPDGVTMHALRHRFATVTYSAHENLLGVQELLGHASPRTTQRYVQLDRAKLRDLIGAAA